MLMIGRINTVLVLALILLARVSYGTGNWTGRYITWVNSSNNWPQKLKLCASRKNESMCGTITCDKFECTRETHCGHQQFYQVWKAYPTYKCSSESAINKTTSSKTFTTCATSTITPVIYYNNANSTQILGILVAMLVVLLVLVTSGWVWTCWMMKKLRKQIKLSQTSNILMSAVDTNTSTAYIGYENTPFEDTTCQVTFQPSTDYSLLQPTTKPNSEMTVIVSGKDALFSDLNAPKYHTLKRGNERSKVKTSGPWCQQGGGTENYSVLTYD